MTKQEKIDIALRRLRALRNIEDWEDGYGHVRDILYDLLEQLGAEEVVKLCIHYDKEGF
jgi:hypothetical protein